MPTPTPNQGLLLPDIDDLSAPPAHFGLYNNGVEGRLVQRYLNEVDRSVRNPSPEDGELSYLRAEDRYERASGGSWVTLFSAGSWNSYVPQWSSVSGTGPTIGNGSLSGRYQQIGKTVNMVARVTMGSTSSYGSASQWTISLPVPGRSFQIIPGRVVDASAPDAYLAIGHTTNGDYWQLEVNMSSGDTNQIRQGFPITFATGDVIHIQGTYEAQ